MNGDSKPSVSRIIEQCLNLTITLAPSVIKFPTTVQGFNTVKQSFYNSARFPNVFGVVDGSQIPIKAPRENEPIFVCRKQFHSINVQLICGPDYKFFDIESKWPGSIYDSFIYKHCAARRRINSSEFGEGWFIGKQRQELVYL